MDWKTRKQEQDGIGTTDFAGNKKEENYGLRGLRGLKKDEIVV